VRERSRIVRPQWVDKSHWPIRQTLGVAGNCGGRQTFYEEAQVDFCIAFRVDESDLAAASISELVRP
jgi:hypothetical protein